MTRAALGVSQVRMNAHYRQIMTGRLTHAERDARFARAEGDPHATAKAQARLDTLRAALDIYAAAHLHAHGRRPWPREDRG